MSFKNLMLLVSEGKIQSNGLIKNVHLIGTRASNTVKGQKEPYTYKEAALKAAVSLYENVDVNIDHRKKGEEASVLTKIGYVVPKTTRFEEGKGVFGDIQLNTEHPLYESIAWWAEHNPSKIGMSHVAVAQFSEAENAIIEIRKVESVDIVANASTTQGLFKEGVIGDAIAIDDEKNKLHRVLNKAWQLIYDVQYPMQGEVLTLAEKATKMQPIVRDLQAELKAIAATTTVKKESTMEWDKITLDDLKKNRADLVTAIESKAVDAEKALDAKVTEAVKDVPEQLRSAVFVKLVRESIASGSDAKDLIEDRKAIKVVTVEAAGTKAPETTPKTVVTQESVKFTVDDIVKLAVKK